MSSSDASTEGLPQGSAVESPVLLHVWVVDPDQERVAVEQLEHMLGQIAAEPGFVSARVLESADRLSVAVVVEMRSPEDRQRLEQLPVLRETLDNLSGTINMVLKLYREVAAYQGGTR
jgi:heme-degrading monooxygenase HmoA